MNDMKEKIRIAKETQLTLPECDLFTLRECGGRIETGLENWQRGLKK